MDIKKHGLILEAETTDCTIEVYLNGIPVGLCGLGGSRKLSRPVHEFMLDGENEISVLVNPGDTPATADQFSRKEKPAYGAQPGPDPILDAYLASIREEEEQKKTAAAQRKSNENGSGENETGENGNGESVDGSDAQSSGGDSTLAFTVELNLYEIGVIAGGDDPETILSLKWRANGEPGILRDLQPSFPLAEENAVGPQLFPLLLTARGDVGEMFGTPHWANAEPLTLDDEMIDEVQQFVIFIRDLIEEGDADPILDISTEMYAEVAAAYDLSAEERAALFRQAIAQESQKPYWIFETPEDEDFSLRLCAGNRLIECVGPDWRPVIRGVPSPDGRFMYPMLIGKIGDEWRIMRQV